MTDQPAMPSPARAADRSIALAVRLGIPRSEAPRLIARICTDTAIRLSDQGISDLGWLWQVQDRALSRSGDRDLS